MTEQQKEAAILHMAGASPVFHKGKYGKQYDSHTCGACGYVLTVTNNYCPNCGTRALWTNPRCLHGQGEQMSLDDFLKGGS